MTNPSAPDDRPDLGDPGSLLVEEQRFAVVPEWVIDAEISDGAFRLYSLLLRYGNSSGCRMPSRALLARRLHRSVDTVDRAMRELVAAGVVRVEHRHDGLQHLTNRYHVRTTNPHPQTRRSDGGRSSAATPDRPFEGGRMRAATPGRTGAATVAADLRPNPEIPTDIPPPPTPARHADRHRAREEEWGGQLLNECDIDDLDALAARCAESRRAAGQSATRWTPACLIPAITLAVRHRGWPARLVEPALLAVAADPSTRSPMRLAEAGPWWDQADGPITADDRELAEWNARLDELDGRRPALQAQARAELESEHLPLTRSSVTRRAIEILGRSPVPGAHAGGDAA
ncbi:MAG: helix-turn-helix domain-containing protein [Jiangellaceae bacterium]